MQHSIDRGKQKTLSMQNQGQELKCLVLKRRVLRRSYCTILKLKWTVNTFSVFVCVYRERLCWDSWRPTNWTWMPPWRNFPSTRRLKIKTMTCTVFFLFCHLSVTISSETVVAAWYSGYTNYTLYNHNIYVRHLEYELITNVNPGEKNVIFKSKNNLTLISLHTLS